jgi:hypothetical protein
MSETIAERASLGVIMDQLEILEQSVLDSVKEAFDIDAYKYRWRPRGVPDFPCIYNWLSPSPAEEHAVGVARDTLNLLVSCGIRWSDASTEMDELEKLADQFRLIVDRDLLHNTGLGGKPHKAERKSMNTAADRFNDVPVLCLQFPLIVELDRFIQ